MTVATEESRWEYTGDGELDTYEYKAKIYAKTDLVVYVDETKLTVDVDYTVTGVLDEGGGTVVFTTPPDLDASIVIYIDLPLTQLTNFVDGDKLPAEALEACFDRMVMIAQQFEEVLKKIVKVPIYSVLDDIVIPIQAKSFLKWNDDANAIICVQEWEAGDPLPNHSDSHENGGADEINLDGLSGMPADLETHGTRHEAGGDDAILLDNLGAPEDNTDLDVSTDAHGLCPKLPNDATKFLNGVGGHTVPPGTKIAGDVVQVVNYQTGEVATGTTQTPIDDTIPQNNEGDQYMTLAITPKSATNILKIDVVWNGSSNIAPSFIAALFQDDTANALAASWGVIYSAANQPCQIVFTHWMVAGTTSETTFKVRVGCTSAGTTTFNGLAGGRIFGGVMASSITITEIAA